MGCELAYKALRAVLEGLDRRLAGEGDKKKYCHKGVRSTMIKTLIDEVRFSRGVYEFVTDEGENAFVFF